MVFRPLTVCLVFLSLAASAVHAQPTVTPRDAREPAALAALIADARSTFELIDVRTPAEFLAGHIPTAINIDYREIGDAMADGDRSVPVVLYCRSGNRSGRATRTLRALGYTVIDFGGINRWNGPIESGT